VPGTTAVKLDSDLVTGVQMHAIKTVPPQWSAPRDEHFTVVVDIVVGKDGRVETAHAVSGPEKYYASAEKTAKQWTFEPYRVLGAPKRVQMRIQLSQN
jgi:outer membrane biosynthesis protein TonB